MDPLMTTSTRSCDRCRSTAAWSRWMLVPFWISLSRPCRNTSLKASQLCAARCFPASVAGSRWFCQKDVCWNFGSESTGGAGNSLRHLGGNLDSMVINYLVERPSSGSTSGEWLWTTSKREHVESWINMKIISHIYRTRLWRKFPVIMNL